MKYIVYLTINKKNNKIYIGVHATETPNEFDGYLGCGANVNKPSSYNKGKTHLHNAILKYGTSSFHRIILREFDNLEDALDLEAWLVTEDFVKRVDTYNMIIGGGVPPILNKEVYQFDLKGTFIKKWESIKSITENYQCNKDRIWMCIKDKRSFDNYYWSYENVINVNEFRISKRQYVNQFTKDGILLNSFKNASEAALKLDIDRQSIVNAVYNRTTCSGYFFLSEEDSIEELLESKANKINTNTTKVYRYTLEGIFDREFDSIKDATKNTAKTSHGNIIRAIKNGSKCGGYKWSYEKSEILPDYTPLKAQQIAQYDLQGNLIKIWNSVADCKKEFPSCQKVCRKERKSTKGFYFEYIS